MMSYSYGENGKWIVEMSFTSYGKNWLGCFDWKENIGFC
jgi:hypothetical protein